MKPYKIELIKNFYTLIHELPDGRTLAAIILPSEMEYMYSASCVKVMADGKLIRHKNFTKFIKPATYYEITDPEFRKACRKNMNFIKNSMSLHDRDRHYSSYSNSIKPAYFIDDELNSWLCEVAGKYEVIRLFFGGDAYCNMLTNKGINVGSIVQRFLTSPPVYCEIKDDLQILIRTCNASSLDQWIHCYTSSKREIHPRLHLICDAQSYGDMSLYCTDKVTYHWAQEDVEGAVDDLDAIPRVDDKAAFFKAGVAVCIPKEAYDIFYSTEAKP